MAGLVPAIHVFHSSPLQDVDARDERGHDESELLPWVRWTDPHELIRIK